MLNTTRRQWQRQAIALALAPWCLPIAQPQDVARHWKTSPFALGVASGSPRADGVVLWTRLLIDEADRRMGANSGAANGSVADPVTVRWELFADDAMRQLVRQGQVVTDATRGHSVHVPLRDLPAGRDYWYRFTCGDATSAVGRTRTAPAADAPVQRLGLALGGVVRAALPMWACCKCSRKRASNPTWWWALQPAAWSVLCMPVAKLVPSCSELPRRWKSPPSPIGPCPF